MGSVVRVGGIGWRRSFGDDDEERFAGFCRCGVVVHGKGGDPSNVAAGAVDDAEMIFLLVWVAVVEGPEDVGLE